LAHGLGLVLGRIQRLITLPSEQNPTKIQVIVHPSGGMSPLGFRQFHSLTRLSVKLPLSFANHND